MTGGWFAGLDGVVGDGGDTVERDETANVGETAEIGGAISRILDEAAPEPAAWPDVAVEAGFVDDTNEYYDTLHEVTVAAARTATEARERADDQQLVHAVRAMDDCRRTANELAERLAEWAGSRDAAAGTGVSYARELAAEDGAEAGEASDARQEKTDGGEASDGRQEKTDVDERIHSLAERICALDDEADDLREFVEATARSVAPNLSVLAGPVLAARLVALAGGLEALAKEPSGTVQVLGAEDALFAHLKGGAPSPKHGVIYTHEAVRNTRPEDRGSAARALAGKLSIAARVDHYGGDRRPELADDLAERIERIQARESHQSDRAEDDGEASAGGSG